MAIVPNASRVFSDFREYDDAAYTATRPTESLGSDFDARSSAGSFCPAIGERGDRGILNTGASEIRYCDLPLARSASFEPSQNVPELNKLFFVLNHADG